MINGSAVQTRERPVSLRALILTGGLAVLAVACGANIAEFEARPTTAVQEPANTTLPPPTLVPATEPLESTTSAATPEPTGTPVPVLQPLQVDPSGPSGVSWSLVFQDEFEGITLEPSRWTACYWWDDDGCTNKGNNELQWYVPEQGTVTDGVLILRAESDAVTTRSGDTFEYRSGMVTTGRDSDDRSQEPRFAFTYGLVEARVRVPQGAGLWPAIWLLPITHDSRPEIDIMETLGDSTELVEFHLHTTGSNGEPISVGEGYRSDELSSGWHVFSIDWTPEALTWLVDGVERWRLQANVPDEPLYLLLNLAVGGDYGGPPDSQTVFPAEFEVDYVRIWQQDHPAYSSTGQAALGGGG